MIRDAGRGPDASSADAGTRDAGARDDAGRDAGRVEPCETPGALETVACGRCGTTTRTCSDGRVWMYEACGGEGECAAGSERSLTCGNCGAQTQVCTEACAWDAPSACAGEGECAPGERVQSSEGCAAGETRELACDDTCTFVADTACAPEPCPTPGAVERVACGTRCGTRERFCTAAGEWTYGACEGEGECEAGTTDSVPCGDCGTRTARCTASCTWELSAPCTGEGECSPGSTSRTTAGCPLGSSRPVTCNATCMLETGACMVDDCAPGAMETVACGMCGTRVRTCDAARTWVYGTCSGEGACMPGTTGTQGCGLCGTQPTRCTTSCAWEAAAACMGEMTCTPPADMCVSPSTLRTYTGGTTCAAGVCSYAYTDVACTGGCSGGTCAGRSLLLRGFGGPAGFGTGVLSSNDDGSSPAIPLSGAFPSGLRYYGAIHDTTFVNNNGNISFGAAVAAYTAAFPRTGPPIIAPWWGDADTRGAGQPARNNVNWHAEPGRVIVTWHLVGYYSMHDDLQNSFQLVLIDRSDVAVGDFDVELRYEACAWTTGDASGGTGGLGGTPARAGFEAGDGATYSELPGSGTASVLSLCTTSNTGTPGLWRYQVRGGLPL